MTRITELLERIVELLEAAEQRADIDRVSSYTVPCPACAAPARQLCSGRDGAWTASPHGARAALARDEVALPGAPPSSLVRPAADRSPYRVACPYCSAQPGDPCIRTTDPVGQVNPTAHPVRRALAEGDLTGSDLTDQQPEP